MRGKILPLVTPHAVPSAHCTAPSGHRELHTLPHNPKSQQWCRRGSNFSAKLLASLNVKGDTFFFLKKVLNEVQYLKELQHQIKNIDIKNGEIIVQC